MSVQTEAYVIMMTDDEMWHPALIFTDKDEAENASDILTARVRGDGSGWKYPSFTVHAVPLNLTIADTGTRRVVSVPQEDDDISVPLADLDLIDDPDDAIFFALLPDKHPDGYETCGHLLRLETEKEMQ